MTVESNDKCNEDLGTEGLKDPMICVGYFEGSITACQVNGQSFISKS